MLIASVNTTATAPAMFVAARSLRPSRSEKCAIASSPARNDTNTETA
jgi:hypothetical protein